MAEKTPDPSKVDAFLAWLSSFTKELIAEGYPKTEEQARLESQNAYLEWLRDGHRQRAASKEAPAPRDPSLLPLLEAELRCISISKGRLIATYWLNGDIMHHAIFDLSQAKDARVSVEDLEGVFVDVFHVEAARGLE